MFIFEENDASSYLDLEAEDLVVTNLLSKYEISTKTTFLYNLNDDYQALIDYISELYVDNKEIPQDIKNELLNNLNFRAYLLVSIENKMNNILNDNNTVLFKEIVTIVNLLSHGKEFGIFESYDFYNLDNLGKLFREYEDRLTKLNTEIEDEDFEITFKQYVMLIETINELCIINSTDVLRKKTINPIINTLSETINLVKFNVKLEEKKINLLNNILGKLLFYYSHIPYINTKNKNANYLIDEFKFLFEKLRDGYQLSKNTNFAQDKDTEKYYKVFLNSLTTLLSTLIYKLEVTYKENDYSDIKNFLDIIDLYEETITHKKIKKFESLNDFKINLLENYNYIYTQNNENNYLNILDNFIEEPHFDSSNMHVIHSIVLFSKDVKDEKLLAILEYLVNLEKFKNDYHEFYKLNVCDVIINKFTKSNTQILTKDHISKIISYIEENKLASHLMSIYSKVYLSLSLYFSTFEDIESLEMSKLYYFNYVSINGKDLLDNEYSSIKNEIMLNHGDKYLSNLNLDGVVVSDEKLIEIGEKSLKKYSTQQDINMKYIINQKLSNIVTDIFTNDGLDDDLLNNHIENFISRDIFHGLTFTKVDGLCENECKLIDVGYEKIEIPLIDGYTLKMAYSKVYKHVFENIYEANKEYIKQNIINLIISYLKSIPIYYDVVTRLYNIDKLKRDLLKRDDNEFIFIEFYIKNIEELNIKYNYSKTNEIFKEYSNNIDKLISHTYRLSGPKLGMILEADADYKSIIEKIKNLKMVYNDDEIKTDIIFAISWGNKDNILEKSLYSVSLAKQSNDEYYEFK